MRLFLSVLTVLLAVNVSLADSRPNIIVFYTDDHGHADLSCQGVLQDIKTPNVDALAKQGVLARHGYSTAPQCVPSRAGLLVGKFQSRFGVESNGKSLDGFNRELTIAERLQAAGYATAQFGKWHLGPGPKITDHGFQHVFNQNGQRAFAANITLDGQDREMSSLAPELYHVDACSRAAASIIKRYRNQPFFLYIAYRAPHVPLDAPRKYLDRFPGEMPQRRRQALAMLSAVDDGVGLITSTLKQLKLSEKTLIFYIGDNGAPLKIHKLDAPGGGPGWDGSLNDPLNGEKGMLSEGGMHVPFVISWPNTIPAGQVFPHPISALDVAATVAGLTNLKTKTSDLDGVNLIPHLTGKVNTPPHEFLTWRWVSQSAIRAGKWKLLIGGDRQYLFDLHADLEEKNNLIQKHPEIAAGLRSKLSSWAAELQPPGLSTGAMSRAATNYFDYYLDGKPAPPLPAKTPTKSATRRKAKTAAAGSSLWIARGAKLTRTKAGLEIRSQLKDARPPFVTRNGLQLDGPVAVKLTIKSSQPGPVAFAWRNEGDKEFPKSKRHKVELKKKNEWQTIETSLPSEKAIIHLRIHVPAGQTVIRSVELKPARGKTVTLER